MQKEIVLLPVVVAESEFTQVVYREGRRGDTLWVTWGDMGSRETGSTVWGQSLFNKMDVPCLGFVAKGQFWYPEHDTFNLINASAGILSRFSKRISYGFSMGGYAALKFSSRLRSSESLAFSPQFSIEPSLVGDFERDYISRFNPDLHVGMGIRREDLCPTNYVVYDPLYRPDRKHFELIMSAESGPMEAVKGIVAPGFGHQSINVVGQTGNAEELLGLVATAWTNVPKEFRKSLRWRRPLSNFYWKGLGDAAALRGHVSLATSAKKRQGATWEMKNSPIRLDLRQLFTLQVAYPNACCLSGNPVLKHLFPAPSEGSNTFVITVMDDIKDAPVSATRLIIVGTEDGRWRDAELRFGWRRFSNATLIDSENYCPADVSAVFESLQ